MIIVATLLRIQPSHLVRPPFQHSRSIIQLDWVGITWKTWPRVQEWVGVVSHKCVSEVLHYLWVVWETGSSFHANNPRHLIYSPFSNSRGSEKLWVAKFFGPAEVLGLPKIVSLWESPGHRWVNCEGIQCFIYPRPGPNACGFWLSLWVFIDSYELTVEEVVAVKLCHYQTLLLNPEYWTTGGCVSQ